MTPELLELFHQTQLQLQQNLREFQEYYHESSRLPIEDLQLQQFHVTFNAVCGNVPFEQLREYGTNRKALPFNERFFKLFYPLFSFDNQSGAANIEWLGVIEAASIEKTVYSLFSGHYKRAHSDQFFNSHRLYENFDKELLGFTQYFLGKLKEKSTTDEQKTFRPFYISILSKEFFEKDALKCNPDIEICHAINTDRELCNETFAELQMEKCRKCKLREGFPSFDCEYAPYHKKLSDGILISRELINEIDEKINHTNDRVFDNYLLEEIAGSVNSTNLFYFTNKEAKKESYFANNEGDVLKKEFIKYLIWLRKLGQNWAEYWYFPIPDLAGQGLHGITIGLRGKPINSWFFYLVLYHAPKFFERAALRTTIEVLNQARIAAVSQVMSRNMSHNMGSHVLADLSTKTRIKEVLKKYSSGDDSNDIMYPTVSIAAFNQYLKARMDLLADIATATPVIENQKHLKDDIITPFKHTKLLMSRITGIAGCVVDVTSSVESDQLNNASLAIPNDILGVQAFYVILENFIRNCAKHEHHYRNSIDIKVVLADYDDELYRVRLYRDQKIPIYEAPEKKRELEELVKARNRDIMLSVLKDGRLRPTAWGILEMKIAASYLRGKPVEDVDRVYEPLLLDSYVSKGGLGYVFYLKKPKELLIVKTGDRIKEFARFGIECIDAGRLDDGCKTFPHRLMVLLDPSDEVKQKISMYQYKLPARILIMSDKDPIFEKTSNVKNLADASSVIADVWSRYAKDILGDGQIICKIKDGSAREGSMLFQFPETGRSKAPVYALFHKHSSSFDGANYHYYEAHGSSDNIGHLINDFDKQKHLSYELVEAITTKIAVVDERVQDYVYRSTDSCNGSPLDKCLERTGIYVPPLEINLNKINFNEQDAMVRIKERVIEWVKEKISDNYQFIILHLGILEKIYGKDPTVKINDLLKGNKNTRIIITSGRGRKPEDVPDNMLFLPYSAVSQYVVENRSKYHLTQLAYAARSSR